MAEVYKIMGAVGNSWIIRTICQVPYYLGKFIANNTRVKWMKERTLRPFIYEKRIIVI